MANMRQHLDSGAGQFLQLSNPDSNDDGTKYRWCDKTIPYPGVFVDLRPCGCVVCPECLLVKHAQRGISLLECNKCGIEVQSHQFHQSLTPKEKVDYNNQKESVNDLVLERFEPF